MLTSQLQYKMCDVFLVMPKSTPGRKEKQYVFMKRTELSLILSHLSEGLCGLLVSN